MKHRHGSHRHLTEAKAKELRARWFATLSEDEKDAIIRREFERRFPDKEAVKKQQQALQDPISFFISAVRQIRPPKPAVS